MRSLVILFFGLAAIGRAGAVDLPVGETAGCMEGPLEQFGRYIGDWNIEDEELAEDGSRWVAGDGARWIFVCLGDGTAIQDYWLPEDGRVGTNLRMYNEETGKWDIAWMIDSLPRFVHIEAERQNDDTIVMHYVEPIPDPLRRVTFHPPEENSWDWMLEYSRDGGETWREVYRIHATRRGAD